MSGLAAVDSLACEACELCVVEVIAVLDCVLLTDLMSFVGSCMNPDFEVGDTYCFWYAI